MIQPYFEVFYSLLVGENFRALKIHQFVILSYQLLPLATSKLMGDNKEFNNSAIFWGVLLIVGEGKLQNIEDSSIGDPWLPIVAPSNQ